jgi:hypothetical protein
MKMLRDLKYKPLMAGERLLRRDAVAVNMRWLSRMIKFIICEMF